MFLTFLEILRTLLEEHSSSNKMAIFGGDQEVCPAWGAYEDPSKGLLKPPSHPQPRMGRVFCFHC